MKTIILYASKYGCTEKCVKMVKDDLEGKADIVNLKNAKEVDLSNYDKVIIGGSVYIGQIRKEVKKFLSKYKDQLLTKQLGLFIVGMPQDGNYINEFNMNFPQELLDKAVVKEYFGGEFNLEKMNFFEKLILKKVGNITTNQSNILNDKIHSFALAMK